MAKKVIVNQTPITSKSDPVGRLIVKHNLVKKNPSVRLCLTVPADGVSLKVTGPNGRMVGTLIITNYGVKFIKANFKKAPEHILTWKVLERMTEVWS